MSHWKAIVISIVSTFAVVAISNRVAILRKGLGT